MATFQIANNSNSNHRPIFFKSYNKITTSTKKYKSFISGGKILYNSSGTSIKTITTQKIGYPGRQLFGAEHTVQNIYSAGPNKLRIGVF